MFEGKIFIFGIFEIGTSATEVLFDREIFFDILLVQRFENKFRAIGKFSFLVYLR